jgi:hypothetical protein
LPRWSRPASSGIFARRKLFEVQSQKRLAFTVSKTLVPLPLSRPCTTIELAALPPNADQRQGALTPCGWSTQS